MTYNINIDIGGLMQQGCNSITNALELHLSCTNPSIYSMQIVEDHKNCGIFNWKYNLKHLICFKWAIVGTVILVTSPSSLSSHS